MSTRDAPKQVAALGYSRDRENAPKVLAKGGGEVAETILRHAEEHGIPIEADPDLLQCLAPLAVGDEIPVEAYMAVAQILAFVYELNGE